MTIARTTATAKIEATLYEPTFYKVIQGGACFCVNTPVLMANGEYKNIEELKAGDRVLSRDINGDIIETEVRRMWYAGNSKPIIKIKVNGREIRATYDHKFYTSRGYEELYKIVWGKMEAGQRIQLKLLCEQYGADIYLDSVWEQGRENNSGSQSSSRNMDSESGKQTSDKSQEWDNYGQSGGESGMGYNVGKSKACLSDGIDDSESGGRKLPLANDRGQSERVKEAMGLGERKTSQKGICGKVWGFRGDNKRYSREQNLEAFAIDEIQVEEPQEVYSLEINHPSHNYFVSEAKINVSNSSSKTFSILILLIGYAESYPNSLITVAGMTYNHLATGAMRDFKNIMRETNRWEDVNFNKSAKIYTFRNGSQIEFLSLDSMTSRGPRRDVLFVNEANGIDYETFDQLATRTKDFVILDYNPSARFWAHDELVEGKQKDRTSFIILTYEDNEALSKQERENIESRKPKEGEEPSNYWIVYGLGQIGTLEGNIYRNWIAEKEKPEGYVLRRRGVDFGFSNDPTAVIDVYENEKGEIFAETMIYEKGLLTPELIKKLERLEPTLAVCDNARPEIIAEMKRAGLRAIACDKTAGEKMNGKRYNIELVQRRIVHYLKSDQDLEKEYLSYAWRKKRSTGEWLDEPEDGNDHDLDALSYAIRDMAKHRIQF